MDRNKIYIAVKERMLTVLSEEKAKQEKYFNLLLENTQELMLLLDHELRLVYCSESFLRQMQIRDFNVINGSSFQEVFSNKVEQGTVEYMQTCLEAVVADQNAVVLLRTLDIGKQGTNRHYRIFITPMLDERGDSKGALVIFNDETDAVEAKEEAEAANKAKSSFLAQMSHEIRTPLNAIIGMSELAIRDSIAPDSGISEYLINIRQAGSNLLSIINDILDLSKIESGSFQLVPAYYRFSSLINNVISVIRIRFAEKPIIFIVNVEAGIPNDLTGDEVRIRQILFNMLSNAIKYTHRGFIKLSVWHKIQDDRDVTLYFEVADSGIGIKAEDLPGLFGDFTRLDLERNKGIEGTGLGLAITKRLCQEMSGGITVSSEYGKGSVFTVVLPQTCSGTAKLARVEHPERKGVLLYDERPLYAQSITATLRNLEVHVTRAASAEEFFAELGRDRHPFVFVSSSLINEAALLIRRTNGKTTLVLLAGMGETFAFQDMPVLMMPAYVVPIANMLNGITVSPEVKKTVVRFTAPQAKVLIVDDIMTNLKVVQGLLIPYRMQVDICDNGHSAVAMAKENHYDIIFMDHMMPGLDGIEATAQIRALEGEYFSRVPIIALTANAISGMREMFLSKGFNDYLSKPIEISRLNEIVEKWIPAQKRLKATRDTANLTHADGNEDERGKPQNRLAASGTALNQAHFFKLKQALETGHTSVIDVTLDELVMLPLTGDEKNTLQNIWDYIMASENKKAIALVEELAGEATYTTLSSSVKSWHLGPF
ncbi:MAG: response regulator [Treponema sp.]|jgi:PAS domain S-box-containing protein|nr:response regulator [Treponema sp.]